jgi:hypothetical protein
MEFGQADWTHDDCQEDGVSDLSASPATAPALGTLENAQRFLQAARHFTDEIERCEAIEQVCAQFDCEDLVEYLLPFLSDPEPLVRVNAIDTLEGIPQPQIDVHRAGQRLPWWRRWSRA